MTHNLKPTPRGARARGIPGHHGPAPATWQRSHRRSYPRHDPADPNRRTLARHGLDGDSQPIAALCWLPPLRYAAVSGANRSSLAFGRGRLCGLLARPHLGTSAPVPFREPITSKHAEHDKGNITTRHRWIVDAHGRDADPTAQAKRPPQPTGAAGACRPMLCCTTTKKGGQAGYPSGKPTPLASYASTLI